MGLDDFRLVRSAVLVGTETFAGWTLATLALPLLLRQQPVHRRPRPETRLDPLGTALLALGAVRSATALAAMLSAAVQRRHLYVWALFAPRFAFEACFLILSDVAALAISVARGNEA